ncbi:TPA: DMSO/selenate family reductase complex A subunit [Klebsiella pneumoniae]
MSNQESPGGVSRRALLKSTALGSLALAAGGLTLPFTLRRAAAAVQQATGDTTRIVWGACSVNCGSRCALRLHVRDDEVVYVETDNTGDDRYGDHQVRACLRGRSIRRRINHPDRLNYPMKRVGKRGEGKFVRISWQEALDTLADRLKSVVAQYGNEAVYINYSSGIVGGNITRSSPSASPVARLMNCYGGSLNQYGTYSTAQIACAMPYTYGSNDGNSTSDIENSKLVVMFGNNPAETRMSGGGITWYLEQARERSNARMIVIDPRYTDTAAGREDEWIPIRPGTDAALVAGIAWVLINEDLVDQPFLDKYCVGYDEKTLPAGAPANGHYKAYILGEGDDGIAKTPQWASRITGIPTERIIKLAREIGMSKPAYICQGWGPQRQANGELTARAIAMLPILTGNVGINGGNSGARESTYTITIERLPVLENPVKTAISCFTWTDAIARGPEMTASRDGVRGKEKLDVPIKFLWNYAGNTIINQHSDINKTHEILQDEMTVLLSGPLFAALLLRLAKVDFNGWFFAGLSVAALVISAAVIIMQSAGLSTLHSSVQQAATLLPDYGKLQALRLVLLALGLGCWLCPLIRRQPPRATGLLIGLLLVLIAECIGRGLFYGLHMTVGMAVAG